MELRWSCYALHSTPAGKVKRGKTNRFYIKAVTFPLFVEIISASMSTTLDLGVLRHLAKSLLSVSALVICSSHTLSERDTIQGAITWASVVTLLGAAYYLQARLWKALYKKSSDKKRRKGRGFQEFISRRHGLSRHHAEHYTFDHGASSSNDSNNDSSSSAEDSVFTITEDEPKLTQYTHSSGPTPGPTLGSTHVTHDTHATHPLELTMHGVCVYVYAWGLLLFVCLYALSALDVSASCWFILGMLALSFDELMSRGLHNAPIILFGLCLAVAVLALWNAEITIKDGLALADALLSSKSPVLFLNFVLGIVLPVSTPFLFFTVRASVRNTVSISDAKRTSNLLCELAMPFMAVLALAALIAVSGACSDDDNTRISSTASTSLHFHIPGNNASGGRHADTITDTQTSQNQTARRLLQDNNNTVQTDATVDILSHMLKARHTLNYTLLFLAPFAAALLLRVLITSVMTGYTTEFIASLLLVVTAKHVATSPASSWALVASLAACAAFLLLLFIMRGK
jgi:hypothetical protein